ncbi:hypothetical protein CK203_115556 [Vitis vinifera]|uniref:Uncharacterized protein n=1 Tax=Vitis vinifera TaxID=29760 RepID=A0A438CBU0_VITVI|nr:hypothetical protein CK203_115556 [Vitis vinifera]
MSEGLVRTLGSRRFLDWGVMGAQGAAGGILICWDKMTLEECTGRFLKKKGIFYGKSSGQ